MTKKVLFNLASSYVGNAANGILVGDFNNWKIEEGIYMEKLQDGSMAAELYLTEGKTYQYRYLLSDGRWVNDDNEKRVVEAFGERVENCIIKVPVDGEKVTTRKRNKKDKTEKQAPVSLKLTDISGITKEVEAVLAADGISQVAELAKCTMKRLLLLLDEAGMSSRVSHHTTWVKQAKLAAAGRTKEWEAVKAELKKTK